MNKTLIYKNPKIQIDADTRSLFLNDKELTPGKFIEISSFTYHSKYKAPSETFVAMQKRFKKPHKSLSKNEQKTLLTEMMPNLPTAPSTKIKGVKKRASKPSGKFIYFWTGNKIENWPWGYFVRSYGLRVGVETGEFDIVKMELKVGEDPD